MSEAVSSLAIVALQASFDDLGTHLSQVTFCVVDLETTGGAQTDMITEVGPGLAHPGSACSRLQGEAPAVAEEVQRSIEGGVALGGAVGGFHASYFTNRLVS